VGVLLTLALVIESVIPGLQYSAACTSTIELRNLSSRKVQVELEGHRSSGALAPWKEQVGQQMELQPLQRATFRLDIDADTAWVKVRESVPESIAVSGVTECVTGDQLRSVTAEVAFPTASPWFSGDVAELAGGEIYLN
jgi:hypothetical protein